MLSKKWRSDSFTFRFVLIAGVAFALTSIFGALSILQGPRVRSVIINTSRLTSQPNQQIILKTNQPLGPISDKDVSIMPRAPINVLSSGNSIAVQFTSPLAYNTKYTIKVRPKGLSETSYSFTTKQASIYFMRKNAGGLTNEILSIPIKGGKQTVVATMANMQDFVAVNDALIVNVRKPDYTTVLKRFNLQTGKWSDIKLPLAGSVTQLRSSPNKQLFGFAFTDKTGSEKYNVTLLVYDASGKQIAPPTGFDKKPLHTLDWRFGQDSKTIISQGLDNDTVITSLDNNTLPVPVGQAGLGGITYDGKQSILTDSVGVFGLNLATNTKTRLTVPSIGKDTFIMNVSPYNAGPGYILHGQATFGADYKEYLANIIGNTSKAVLVLNKGESTVSYGTSPNDQYIILDTLAFKDGASKHMLRVIDKQSGKIILRTEGTTPNWQ